MSDKVISLVERKKPLVNESVVQELEFQLARAKSGEIDGIALVMRETSGQVSTAIFCENDRFALSHGISALAYRFHKIMDDEARGAGGEG